MSADSTFASTITATSDSTDSNDVMAGDELAIVSSDGGGLKISVSGNSLRGGDKVLFTMVAASCKDTWGATCKAPNVCVQHFPYNDVGGKCVSPCVGTERCCSQNSGEPYCACPAGQACWLTCQKP